MKTHMNNQSLLLSSAALLALFVSQHVSACPAKVTNDTDSDYYIVLKVGKGKSVDFGSKKVMAEYDVIKDMPKSMYHVKQTACGANKELVSLNIKDIISDPLSDTFPCNYMVNDNVSKKCADMKDARKEASKKTSSKKDHKKNSSKKTNKTKSTK